MEWKDAVGSLIENNLFLKTTSSYDGLSKYVREEVERICNELEVKANGAGTLMIEKKHEEIFNYDIPFADNSRKGIQVEYNDESKVVILRRLSIDGETLLAEIVPYDDGAKVRFYDKKGKWQNDNAINKKTIESLFSAALY